MNIFALLGRLEPAARRISLIVPALCHASCAMRERRVASSRAATPVSPMKAAPPQRDLLLCEADHRIKNSLQLVAAVLQLQAKRSSEFQSPQEALMQASRRVRAIAQVHDRLQESASGDVAFADYLRHLCADLSHSLAGPEAELVMVEAEEVALPAARAMAVGLIVNELVTNALKHGRRNDGTGQVRVVASVDPDDILRLVVADDGPGLPNGFDPGSCSGLGMRLVSDLLRRLAGHLDVDGAPPGTRFTLRLPMQAVRRASGPSGREDA